VSQLGQGWTLTDNIFFFPTGCITSAESESTNFSNCAYALRGGARYVEWYICFTIEQSKLTNPLLFKRSDLRKSCKITVLNAPYSGVTVAKFPYYAYTSGHHVNVDLPSKSGSIQDVIFYTKVDAKRGCSSKLLKKRTQFF
jgi:hypothetical protein